MLTVEEFKNSFVVPDISTHCKKRGKQHIEFLDDIMTYDCEVTTIPGDDPPRTAKGLLYVWSACVFGTTVYGRTVEEFKDLIIFLYKKMHLGFKRRLTCYVHNLEYDFIFLLGLIPFKEIFATAKRAVLYAYGYGLEFRCSYKLSNMSLDKFGEQMQVKHRKLSGEEFNYSVIRTPDTILDPDKELPYIEHDVLALYEAVINKFNIEGDNAATTPLTSTGYVRRACRNAMAKNPKNRELFERLRMDPHMFDLCNRAFRGGDCHANRFRSGKIWENVDSFDLASSYPAVLMYNKYACEPFRKQNIHTMSDIKALKYLLDNDYAIIMNVTFYDIAARGSVPYIPLDKCYDIERYTNDNGRILRADMASMVINEDDFYIIADSYTMSDFYIKECYVAKTAPLPVEFRQVVYDFFKRKSKLKGNKVRKYEYDRLKALLNALYGMTAQNPVHEKVVLNGGTWDTVDPDTADALDHFYKSENSFLPYQWCVKVTSAARRRLYEAIKLIDNGEKAEKSKFIYADTDSVKFIHDERVIAGIEKINERIIKQAEACDVPAIAYTESGERQVLGVFDFDDHYDKFITYGAKKYAYEKEGQFYCTVSGLNKKKGAKEIGTIDNFKLGLTIHDSGRTISIYDDDINEHYVNVNGKDYKIRANIAILNTTYTLGVSKEYGELAPNIVVGSVYDEEVTL